ncbi:hypothetical protein QFC22_002717 [Naganishia vaughanmartiniae]|uniref:Uncharacterized protein n=1 Tax=Naganishia vaughanmartiniae TaxID=1424756 RepID=A0ACC2XBI5_9TREE|nr:hypothetical protein QFC22_002717 [Naganishia vaughanmartiniae]
MNTSSPASDTRRKQSKRDETLRRKIESELSRKRGTPTPASSGGQSYFQSQSNTQQPGRSSKRTAQKGTVAGLKPSPALTVPESMSVADASQLCAAKRTDCVLVVDDEEGLSGIFTAKDLAFRVTAEGLDPRTTLVSQIMTKNPMVTRDTTSATQALQLMVEKHFRHLPVCNEDGDVVGLLDITKVFHEALAKVERSSTASAQLHAALAGVQTELGGSMAANPQAAAMMAYAQALQDKMALPDLTTVLNSRLAPATVTARTTVKEAAKMMKDRRTTAVCVMESPTVSTTASSLSGVSGNGAANQKIAGIFTSKDIVLRVIAAGLDASRCSVVRVMTPHPDTAPPTMSVQEALKKMYTGHYLNLPVVESDGRLMGIVDVLKLTYATLEQIESIAEGTGTGSDSGGPLWGKFFSDLGQAAGPDDETNSMVSAQYQDTPATPNIPRHLRDVTSPHSEVQPGDSASMADDGVSEIGKLPGAASSVAPALETDDGTFFFKFRTPSGRTHRFGARNDNVENLRDIVYGKLSTDPFFNGEQGIEGQAVHLPDPAVFTMSYTDDDGDLVTITSDDDVADAVRVARSQKLVRVVLVIQGDKVWEEAARDVGGQKAVDALKEAAEEVAAPADKEEKALEDKAADPAEVPTFGQSEKVHARKIVELPLEDKVMGIPRDLLLPASMGFLGVVIVGVFIASRASK